MTEPLVTPTSVESFQFTPTTAPEHLSTAIRVVNLAGGAPVRLDLAVRTLAEVLGVPWRIVFAPEQPGDVPETRADLALARDLLGWAPQVGLNEGLRRFVAWLPA